MTHRYFIFLIFADLENLIYEAIYQQTIFSFFLGLENIVYPNFPLGSIQVPRHLRRNHVQAEIPQCFDKNRLAKIIFRSLGADLLINLKVTSLNISAKFIKRWKITVRSYLKFKFAFINGTLAYSNDFLQVELLYIQDVPGYQFYAVILYQLLSYRKLRF